MQGQPQRAPQQYQQAPAQAQPQQYRPQPQGHPVQGQVIRQAPQAQYTRAVPQQQHAFRQVQQPQVVRTAPQNIRNTHAAEERRLDEQSARILARKVFNKYDANHSGYMNSAEAGQLVSDLYGSLNVNHPANNQEGLEFMVANDVNSDHQISLEDFQDIFVRNLSAGMGGYRLFVNDDTYFTGAGVAQPQPVRQQAARVVQAPARTYAQPQGAQVVRQGGYAQAQPQVVRR